MGITEDNKTKSKSKKSINLSVGINPYSYNGIEYEELLKDIVFMWWGFCGGLVGFILLLKYGGVLY